mgnify:CR=1 FL=1
MFTLDQINEAHSKVRSGADFPQYIKDLLSLGVLKYSICVCDGHAEYIGKEDYSIHSKAEYPILHIASEIDSGNFKYHLKAHQQGETDYLTFCRNSAEAGVNKWTVDILAKTCTYYDRSGNLVLEEKIPI